MWLWCFGLHSFFFDALFRHAVRLKAKLAVAVGRKNTRCILGKKGEYFKQLISFSEKPAAHHAATGYLATNPDAEAGQNQLAVPTGLRGSATL